MLAVTIIQPGGVEALTLSRVAIPIPNPNEVLIQVKAIGVNRADIEQRRGFYPPPRGASPILGLEVAGVVAEIGSSCAFKKGDRVMALLQGGGYAEYAVARAEVCFFIPQGVDDIHAAAIPEAYFTVWDNVFTRGRLTAGEFFLVHGGSSGIGMTAIQLAEHFGARIFATAGSKEKCHACEALGALKAINYKEEDFFQVIDAHTEGRGVDVILDMVGQDYFAQNLKLLAREGRLVLISCQSGSQATMALNTLIMRNLSVMGSAMRGRSIQAKTLIADEIQSKLLPLLADGKLKPPVIARTFPLAQVREAHAFLESSQHIGKVVLVV